MGFGHVTVSGEVGGGYSSTVDLYWVKGLTQHDAHLFFFILKQRAHIPTHTPGCDRKWQAYFLTDP